MSNQKEKLFEIISYSENELKKVKIGLLVRNTLPIILSEKLISEIEINNLIKDAYSKTILDVNYPVLREYNKNKSLNENRMVNDHSRYYADYFEYGDKKYLICSEWYERSVVPYIKWLKRKVKTE
nr:hypothetical protein [uncultured Flavobacterium sp.]